MGLVHVRRSFCGAVAVGSYIGYVRGKCIVSLVISKNLWRPRLTIHVITGGLVLRITVKRVAARRQPDPRLPRPLQHTSRQMQCRFRSDFSGPEFHVLRPLVSPSSIKTVLSYLRRKGEEG